MTRTDRGFRVDSGGRRPRSFDVATLPYPGFPTDLQPFAIACNAVADGSAMITENLFEARFRTVQELNRLGAETRIDGHHVMVHGVERLSGAPVEASDIRAGAALVIAGLVADGRHHGQRRPAHRPRLRRLRRAASRGSGPTSRASPTTSSPSRPSAPDLNFLGSWQKVDPRWTCLVQRSSPLSLDPRKLALPDLDLICDNRIDPRMRMYE